MSLDSRRWLIPSQLGMLFVTASLVGCGSLPKPRPEWSERLTVDAQDTTWARTAARSAAGEPGSSGVELVPYGRDALSARLALADTAERSLDLQYYIWLPDNAGRLLAQRVLTAANRGVRVRLLLDDVGGTASDEVLLALNSHTNVQVRIFNPIANRTFRSLSLLSDFQRASRRMHNKSFTVDRSVTILGGRNVAESYFALGKEARYKDIGVILAGPAVGHVEKMFERFWYSTSSIPIQALSPKHLSPTRLAEINASLAAHTKAITNLPDFKALASNELGAALRRHELELVWGPVRMVSDLPEKVTTNPEDESTHLLPALRTVANGTTKELVVVSPYFVPGEKGMEFFRSLRQRGVRVVVLTDSLAANEVLAVHAGYRRYREALLLAGVQLWEMKPDIEIRTSTQQHDSGSTGDSKRPGSSLHGKVMIFDRQNLFVGSFNFSRRSASLNTEDGVVVGIPQLAERAARALEKWLPENAYRVEFVPDPGACRECGHLIWESKENGREVSYSREPRASFSRRLKVDLLSLLPIEKQL